MYYRKKRQYTREVLAEKVDISSKFLYELEVGSKGCSAYILCKLAEAMEVNVCELICMTNNKNDYDLKKILESPHRDKIYSIISILLEIL